MTGEEFSALITEVFDYLQEHYEILESKYARYQVAHEIWAKGVEDRGDPQGNYEFLRDLVEYYIKVYPPNRLGPGVLDWVPGEEW